MSFSLRGLNHIARGTFLGGKVKRSMSRHPGNSCSGTFAGCVSNYLVALRDRFKASGFSLLDPTDSAAHTNNQSHNGSVASDNTMP